MKRLLLALIIFMLGSTYYADAQTTPVPSLMNFQGRLARPDGTPLPDGTYSLTFKLYTVPTGGTSIWSHTLPAVVLRNGVFSVLLGGTQGTFDGPFNSSLFRGNLWLEIKIGAENPLTPRQQIVTTAYAMKADTVKDGAIITNSLANNAVTTAKILNGTITADDIMNGTITAEKLAPGLLPPNAWLLGGNIITDPNTQWLGTKNFQPLIIRVNSQPVMQYEYAEGVLNSMTGQTLRTINLVGGYEGNGVTPNVLAATIGGGGYFDTVNGPVSNLVTDHGGTIGGGAGNRTGNNNADLTDGNFATVSGGANNLATGSVATIGGGNNNTASGIHSVISGGSGNQASGVDATVGGGISNTANSDRATIGGGLGNVASNERTTVGGGYANHARGFSATVGGGTQNTADGAHSTVGGGLEA